MFASLWLQTLISVAMSDLFAPDLLSWLSVVWTFRRPTEFTVLTKAIVLNGA